MALGGDQLSWRTDQTESSRSAGSSGIDLLRPLLINLPICAPKRLIAVLRCFRLLRTELKGKYGYET